MMFRKLYAVDNVEGKSCFVINTGLFIGEVVSALSTGFVINLYQSSTAVVTWACITGAMTAVISVFVEVPPSPPQQTGKESTNYSMMNWKKRMHNILKYFTV